MLTSNTETGTGTQKQLKLPHDFTLDIPNKALLWLYKYEITDEEIKQYRFGWSNTTRRLVLPVYFAENLIYYQGRTFEPVSKENPKYLNIRQSGAKHVFFRRNCLDPTRTKSICIVEDILSAVKVGRHCNALALLGSYFPPSLISLLRTYDQVYIWLDEDKHKDAIKYMASLSAKGIRCKVIKTKLDPKENTDETIKILLS